MKLASLLLSLVFAATAVHAGEIDEILDQPLRPTMAQVDQILDQIHDEPGIPTTAAVAAQYYDQRINFTHWMKLLFKNGPRLIAEFEKTYPGATWVFLGRDGLPWADLFEAYYSELGQPNRVVRLGISKPSMEEVTDQTLVELMADAGIPVATLDKSHPVVFLDSVSGGYGRQGRRLMAAIYSEWIKSGKDPLALVNKLDMIGLVVSTFQGATNDIKFKPFHQYMQALLALQMEEVDQRHFSGDTLFNDLRILTLERMDSQSNEAGYTHFIGAWHDSFGKIKRSRSGTKAVPGEPYPLEMKKSILWLQKKIWEFVRSGNCAQQVKAFAKQSGFSFPAKRPEPTIANPKMLAKFRDKIRRRPGYTNAASADLADFVRSRGANANARPFLLQFFNYSMNLPETETVFKERPEPKTVLSDIQFLGRALEGDTKCESDLEGDL